jgi:hypothetical protein
MDGTDDNNSKTDKKASELLKASSACGSVAGAASGAVLISAQSFTHSFGQNQRMVCLTFSDGGDGDTIEAKMPESPVVFPGDYMLFLVSRRGRPSHSIHIRVVGKDHHYTNDIALPPTWETVCADMRKGNGKDKRNNSAGGGASNIFSRSPAYILLLVIALALFALAAWLWRTGRLRRMCGGDGGGDADVKLGHFYPRQPSISGKQQYAKL